MKPGTHKTEKLTKRPDVVAYLAKHQCLMPEAAVRIGISYKLFRTRLNKGETIADIKADPRPKCVSENWNPPAPETVQAYLDKLGDGVTLVSAANAAGVSPSTVKSRLGRGWEIAKAFSSPADPRYTSRTAIKEDVAPELPPRRLTYRMSGDPVRVNNWARRRMATSSSEGN